MPFASGRRGFRRIILDPSEAQMLIAQDAGFGSWATLGQAKATGQRPVPTFALEIDESRIAPRRQLSDREWDELIAVMTEHRIQRLDAQGLMTDAVLSQSRRRSSTSPA